MKKTIIGGLFFIGGILLMGFAVLGNGDGAVLGYPAIIFALFGCIILIKELFADKIKSINNNYNNIKNNIDNNTDTE